MKFCKFLFVTLAVLAAAVMATSEIRAEAAKSGPDNYVQAYYFHATYRCQRCTTLEQYSREAIETNFKDQLANGTLRFAEINFDEPENRHYLQDFGLTYRALVLVRYKDGKQVGYKNLEKIWQLVGDKTAFLAYVKSETEDYLEEL
jgi:hypothetical protein